jgi:SPP1 family predicted phage head-tail adaptor
MPSLRTGPLRQRVAHQRATLTDDAMGQPVESWATLATVWAAVEPASSAERVLGAQLIATTTHAVRLRGRRDVRPGDRFVWGTRTLSIQGVHNPDGLGVELLCSCEERLDP